jgi:hypothetical protein
MTGSVDARGQQVRCRKCGAEYECTPDRDYFNATTLTDGLCWTCLIAGADLPPQPEPPLVGFTACWKTVEGRSGHCRKPKGHVDDCAPF